MKRYTIFLILSTIFTSINCVAMSPNVLFIVADDLNDWVEPLGGHPDAQTPNISHLASLGVTFTNAHSPVPVCNPARTAAITGLSPLRSGVMTNTQTPMRNYINSNVETLFQYFSSHGYYMAGQGKFLHLPSDDLAEPWNEFGVSNDRGEPLQTPGHGITELIEAYNASFDWGVSNDQDSIWGDYMKASFAENFLRKNHTQPFFLALGFNLPHLPWYVPQADWNAIGPKPSLPTYLAFDRDDMPLKAVKFDVKAHPIIAGAGKWQEAVQAYLAAIRFMDHQVGRTIAALEASPYLNNTIIIFWSDHGYHLGEKGAWLKLTPWEESTRIPMFVVAPGVSIPGGVSGESVSLLDIYPTLIELAGLPAKNSLDGTSLVPLITDPINATQLPTHNAVSSLKHANTLRTTNWRYSHWFFGGEELYDHQNDPNEHVNLALDPAYAAIKESLSEQLAASILPRGDTDGNGEVNFLDILLLQRHLTGLVDLEYSQQFRADVYPHSTSRDGNLDLRDLILMEAMVLK